MTDHSHLALVVAIYIALLLALPVLVFD